MAKVKPKPLIQSLFGTNFTPWIFRNKHKRALDINFRRGSTIISKKNTPKSDSKTAQQIFFRKRFAKLDCMWKSLTPWQKIKIKQFNNLHNIAKSAKSCFFKLGMRFQLYRILYFWNFSPSINLSYDEKTNEYIITVILDKVYTEEEEEQARQEWERMRTRGG